MCSSFWIPVESVAAIMRKVLSSRFYREASFEWTRETTALVLSFIRPPKMDPLPSVAPVYVSMPPCKERRS